MDFVRGVELQKFTNLLEYVVNLYRHMAVSLVNCLRGNVRLAASSVGKNAFYYTRPKSKKKMKSSTRVLAAVGGAIASSTAAGIYFLGICLSAAMNKWLWVLSRET